MQTRPAVHKTLEQEGLKPVKRAVLPRLQRCPIR